VPQLAQIDLSDVSSIVLLIAEEILKADRRLTALGVEQMGVDGQGERNVCMPEAITDDFRIDLAANQDRGVRVSQAVQIEVRERQLLFEFWTLEAEPSEHILPCRATRLDQSERLPPFDVGTSDQVLKTLRRFE
jgi:hypothetical protein